MPIEDANFAEYFKQAIGYREPSSFTYSKEIQKQFGQLTKILDWCKSECQGEWRWQLVDVSSDVRPGRYIFYFDSGRDFVAFSLQWG